jgi:hypothetical protein
VKLPGFLKSLSFWGTALLVAGVVILAGVLKTSQDTVRAQKVTITTLEQRVREDDAKIAQRDQLIATQNTAVRALAEADEAHQEAYRARLAAADLTALAHTERAHAILQATPAADDRCVAALQLITNTIKE